MRMQRLLRVLILSPFVLTVFAGPVAGAHEPGSEDATPPVDRPALLRACRACRLRLRDGTEIRGTLLDVGSDSLGIRVIRQIHRSPFAAASAARVAVSFDQVAEITCGKKDRSWDGALFGFLVGGLPVGFMYMVVTTALREPGYEYENSSTLKAFGIGLAAGGGIGALFGYIFDSAFEQHERDLDAAALRDSWAREP